MEKTLVHKTSLKAKIEQIFEKDRNLHLLFWVLLSIFLLVLDRSDSPVMIKFSRSLISTGFFATIVYVNWSLLIPRFLKKRNYTMYLVSLILLSVLVTPPQVLAMFLLYDDSPSIQHYFYTKQNVLLLQSLFIAVSSAAFKITQDWLGHERDSKELKSQNLASELNFLKSQINPHFLFNTLNNLYALSLKKSDQAPETVLMLSEMMRYMLYECNVERVYLQKEIKYIKNYLELERIRLGDNFDIEFKIEGEAEELQIAPLMFIPFIENSFKHGMNTLLSDGFVHINLKINDGEVDMRIANRKGAVIAKDPDGKQSGGIGLINIKRRLKLIYPNKHKMSFEESDDEYAVQLNIQLN